MQCLTLCSSLQSSLGLRSPHFAGHCIALKCCTPATGMIAGASELSLGFLAPSGVSFSGVKEQSFAPNQRELQLYCKLAARFPDLVTAYTGSGRWTSVFPSLDIPFISLFENLIRATFWDILYFCLQFFINCLLRFVWSTKELEQSLACAYQEHPVVRHILERGCGASGGAAGVGQSSRG